MYFLIIQDRDKKDLKRDRKNGGKTHAKRNEKKQDGLFI